VTKKSKRVQDHQEHVGATTTIDAAQSLALLTRFANEFVVPSKHEAFVMALRRSPVKQKAFDYERYLRPDCTADVTDGRDLLRWLAAGEDEASCIFFQRHAFRPASRFSISSLREDRAMSWPGLFVNFNACRALAVTLDLERFCCDLGRIRAPNRPT